MLSMIRKKISIYICGFVRWDFTKTRNPDPLLMNIIDALGFIRWQQDKAQQDSEHILCVFACTV